MGAIAKTFDRIIPNEIKPIVPIAASMFGAPYLSAVLPGAAATGIMGALRAGAIGAGTNVATQALMGQKIDPRSAITSGIFSGFGTGLRGIEGTSKLATAGRRVGEILAPTSYSPDTGFALTGTGEGLSALTQPITVAATTGGTLSAIDAAEKANEEYERMLEEQGMTEAADENARRDYISRYMNLAGFSQEEINDALSRYGYAKGGRAGFAEGGGSLYDKAKDMNRLALEIKLIDLGYGGFGGKDLDDMTDEEIIQLYEEATSKADGGRIGYRIGGGPVKSFIAKLLNVEPSEEVLNKMFEERKKEIFNSMFDPEAGTGAYSMKQMEEADKKATKLAMEELEDYKKRIGMEMKNPPEGTVGSDVIEQIMAPRKEGRVEEAYGGRIKKSIGGLAFAYDDYLRQADELGLSGDPMTFEEFTDTWLELQSDLGNSEKYKKGGRAGYAEGGYEPLKYSDFQLYEDATYWMGEPIFTLTDDPEAGSFTGDQVIEMIKESKGMKKGGRVKHAEGGYEPGNSKLYKEYLDDLESDIVSPDTTFNEWLDKYYSPEPDYDESYKKGGRAGYAEGGSSTEQQKRENYFDLKRDEFMSLSEYLLSPMSDADLRKGKADGGMMNLAMGGMPAEMDLRPGGFVPIGKKEKADDVPARLSKNEFVFTADAVRAAGGGSVNKGAQRMYDLMHSLEAKV